MEGMFRSKFLSTALVLIVGVNLGAWSLAVGTSSPSSISVLVPVTSQALRAQAFSASAAVPTEEVTPISSVVTAPVATTVPAGIVSKGASENRVLATTTAATHTPLPIPQD